MNVKRDGLFHVLKLFISEVFFVLAAFREHDYSGLFLNCTNLLARPMGLLMSSCSSLQAHDTGSWFWCELKGQSASPLTSQALTVDEFPPQLEAEFPFRQRASATSTVFLDILSSLCVQPSPLSWRSSLCCSRSQAFIA